MTDQPGGGPPVDSSDRPPETRGVVLRDEGSHVIVDLCGEEVACVIRKRLRRGAGKRRKAVVVGDQVEVEYSGDGAAIAKVEPRRTSISRRNPSQPRREQILVANVDAVLIVASAARPAPVPALIDRFLVAIESRGLEPGIVINKTDLDPEGSWEQWGAIYRDLGYRVLPVSATDATGLEEVRAFLANKTTSLLGQSGVGKSTLANALDPTLTLRTGGLHEGTGKGTHTTTTVSLLRLPWGGYLVDTPGIREFGLWNMELADVGIWFREIAARTDACRFNDCLHAREPGCAVLAALEEGEIDRSRHESYLRILETLRESTPEF